MLADMYYCIQVCSLGQLPADIDVASPTPSRRVAGRTPSQSMRAHAGLRPIVDDQEDPWEAGPVMDTLLPMQRGGRGVAGDHRAAMGPPGAPRNTVWFM